MSDLISREDLIKSIDFDVPLNQYERDTLNLVLKRIKALPTVDREESALKALEDVRAEITGNLESIIGKYDSNTKPEDMPSRKIERNNGRTEAIDIINRKIKEIKHESI